MKIKFSDASEIMVKYVSKNRNFDDDNEFDNVTIELFDEQSQAIFENKDLSSFTIVRNGFEDVTIAGYSIKSASSSFDDSNTRYSIELVK